MRFRDRFLRTACWVAAGSAIAWMMMPGSRADAQTSQAVTALPQFEVAAIKPAKPGDGNHSWNNSTDRVSIENYTLRRLISVAYDLKSESQVLGGPKWIGRRAFDISAKIDDADVAKMRKMDSHARRAERNRMLQELLADRFGLKVKRSTRKMPVFALVVLNSGAKVTLAKDQNATYNELSGYNGRMTAVNISMDDLAHDLGTLDEVGGRVVLNRTDLAGVYDFKMNFSRDHGNGIPPDAAYPGLFTALKEQLGLELKPETAPVEVIIVDAATEPELD